MSKYHLAQINVGRPLGTMDSEVMAGFAARLDEINRIADQSPGFVWRLKGESDNATALRIFEDPAMMVNASVWESIEALREFVYRTSHTELLRGKAQWFEKPMQAYMALWWVPAGHIPSIEELRERLEYRRAHGDTAYAFGFTRTFPPPDAEEPATAPPPQNWSTPECGWQD